MERKLQLKTQGFSLVELLLVVVILVILSTAGVISYNNYIIKAKISAVKDINEKAIAYISAETLKCQIGGEILVMERSGPSKVNCSIDPYKQYSIEQIAGNIMGYLDTLNILGNNPFDDNDLEGAFKIDRGVPAKIGRTCCSINNNKIKCISLLDNNKIFTNEYGLQI